MKSAALAACRWALRPLVRMLLKHDVMHKDIVQLTKEVYVEVARSDYGLRGRPTNISRTALLTGLDRKEVSRIREQLEQSTHPAEAVHRQDRITRVLATWHLDPDFLDERGRPRPLKVTGSRVSFEEVVRRASGDVPAVTILNELKRVNAVREQADGTLTVLRRNYRLDTADPEALSRAGSVFADLGKTVTHNLYHDDEELTRFEARVFNSNMPASAIPRYRAFVRGECQILLERIDEWLTAHELEDDSDDGVRLGLGMYWIQD
ncbi:MAG: DUF6502 family protein [Woeseiaceae bacterium]